MRRFFLTFRCNVGMGVSIGIALQSFTSNYFMLGKALSSGELSCIGTGLVFFYSGRGGGGGGGAKIPAVLHIICLKF